LSDQTGSSKRLGFGADLEVSAEQVVEASRSASTAEERPLRLIDVRETEELAVESVEGAEWIPLSEWAERWQGDLADSGECLVFF